MTPGRIEQIRCQVTESAVKAGAAHLGTCAKARAPCSVTQGLARAARHKTSPAG